jgi:competence protein ComEC
VNALADDARSVVVTATLTADPDWTDRLGFGSTPQRQVRVEVRATHLVSPEGSWDVRTPLLVMGDGNGWEEIRLGATVRLRGVLQPEQGVRPIAAMLFTRSPPELLAEPAAVMRGAERMRSGLREAVSGTSPDVQGLLPALVVGDTSALPPALVEDLRASGLAHLTAVSGANVAIVLVAVLLLARLVRVRGYALPVVGVLAVCGFVLLARPEPSVLRAAVMGVLAVVAVVTTGQRRGARLLLAAVVLLLLVDPWLARSWGFALSVAATAGLLALAGRWSNRWAKRWPRPVADGVAVALAAQVATLPLSVALSGQVAVFSVVANVLVAPAVAPATILGAAAAAVSPVAPWLAAIFGWLGQWPTAWIAAVAHRASAAPLATWSWPTGWLGALLAIVVTAFLALLVRGVLRRGLIRRRNGWAAAAILVVLVLVLVNGPARWPPTGWVMVACDVGQGDALVIAGEGDAALVVDTGPVPWDVDRCLDELGVRRIPLLVLTHAHADHVLGLPGVLDGRAVGTVLVSPLAEPAEQADQVADWLSEVPVLIAAAGQVGESDGVRWEVIWPQRVIRGEGSDPNNASVVLMVETHGVRLLLTGDIEPAAQRALALASDELAADVIKVPHHGSRYQDPMFWQEVHPRVALVSAGEDNSYGHPDPTLLTALRDARITVARTDTEGTIAVVVDDGLRVVTSPR